MDVTTRLRTCALVVIMTTVTPTDALAEAERSTATGQAVATQPTTASKLQMLDEAKLLAGKTPPPVPKRRKKYEVQGTKDEVEAITYCRKHVCES